MEVKRDSETDWFQSLKNLWIKILQLTTNLTFCNNILDKCNMLTNWNLQVRNWGSSFSCFCSNLKSLALYDYIKLFSVTNSLTLTTSYPLIARSMRPLDLGKKICRKSVANITIFLISAAAICVGFFVAEAGRYTSGEMTTWSWRRPSVVSFESNPCWGALSQHADHAMRGQRYCCDIITTRTLQNNDCFRRNLDIEMQTVTHAPPPRWSKISMINLEGTS